MKASALEQVKRELGEYRRWRDGARELASGFGEQPCIKTGGFQPTEIRMTPAVRHAVVAAMDAQAETHKQTLEALGVEVDE